MANFPVGMSLHELLHFDDIAETAELSESGYQSVAALHSDTQMKTYARRVLASLDRTVFDENALSGFVQHFSGTLAVQSFAELVSELTKVTWAAHVDEPSILSAHSAPAVHLPASFPAQGHHKNHSNHSSRPEHNSTQPAKAVGGAPSEIVHLNVSMPVPTGGSSAGGSDGSLSKLAGDHPAPASSLSPHHRGGSQALAAVHEAEKAAQAASSRFQSVRKEVQLATKTRADAEKKASAAADSVATLKQEKKTAEKNVKAAQNKERITKTRLAKATKTGKKADAVKFAKELRAVEASVRQAERATKIAGTHLQSAVAAQKKAETVMKARAKGEDVMHAKLESAQSVYQRKKQSAMNATKKLRKQVLELTRLEEKEARMEATHNATAASLTRTHDLRVDAMQKYNFTTGTKAQVLAKTSLTRSKLAPVGKAAARAERRDPAGRKSSRARADARL